MKCLDERLCGNQANCSDTVGRGDPGDTSLLEIVDQRPRGRPPSRRRSLMRSPVIGFLLPTREKLGQLVVSETLQPRRQVHMTSARVAPGDLRRATAQLSR